MFSGQPGDTAVRGNIHQPWTAPVRFLERMFKVPAFRTAYWNLRTYSKTVFVPGAKTGLQQLAQP